MFSGQAHSASNAVLCEGGRVHVPGQDEVRAGGQRHLLRLLSLYLWSATHLHRYEARPTARWVSSFCDYYSFMKYQLK